MIELDKIYNEDCLEGMKRIPDESVDCVICDLPYGTTRNKWDSMIPLDKIWEQYKRITKRNAAICLFGQQPFTSILVMSNLPMFKYEWIWEKEQGTGIYNANYAPLKIHESVLVFSQSAACFVKNKANAMIYHPQKTAGKPYVIKQGGVGTNYDYKNNKETVTVNNGDRHPVDIVKFNRDKDKIHSTQKPVDLVRYLIRTYTEVGGVVLDNCMGSGTTAIAAMREGRRYIGFELDAYYYGKAQERIAEELGE